jgi:hypothetical protein
MGSNSVSGGSKWTRARATDGPDPAAFLEGVVDALRLVAIPPAEQIAALPDFVHVPDEIVLLYDDAFKLVPQIREAGLIDEDQVEVLAELDRLFNDMSVAADKDHLWTVEAMSADERWETSRQIAANALAALCRSVSPPRFEGITWIPGDPSSGTA